jgi:hypothetical protein
MSGHLYLCFMPPCMLFASLYYISLTCTVLCLLNYMVPAYLYSIMYLLSCTISPYLSDACLHVLYYVRLPLICLLDCIMYVCQPVLCLATCTYDVWLPVWSVVCIPD